MEVMEAGRVVVNTTSNGKGLIIGIIGRFNLELHKKFRKVFEEQPRRYERYAVNMQHCTGIDSAGLGMLLILRDFTQLSREDLRLIQCPADVRQVLNYANFEQLFTID